MDTIFDAEYRLLHNKQSKSEYIIVTKDNMQNPFAIAIGRAIVRGNSKFYLDGTEYAIVTSQVFCADMIQVYDRAIARVNANRTKPIAKAASGTDNGVKWQSANRIRFKDTNSTKMQTKLSPAASKWINPNKRRKSKSIRAWQGGSCTPK